MAPGIPPRMDSGGVDYSKFAAQSPVEAEQQREKKAFWTKWRIVGAISVGMLVVAAGVLLGLFLSKKSNDSSPTIAQVADTTATRAPLPSATPAPPFVTSRSPPKNCSLAAAGEKITPPGTNRLAPPAGSPPYIGFSLEWGWDRPLPLLKRLNAAPTIIGGFLQSYAPGTWDSAAFALYTEAAYNMSLSDPSGGLVKPIVNLALMTDYTLDKLNETIMRVWAKEFKRVNEGMGVPIMLRFAHEFNGNWNAYAQKPAQFIKTWRQFTKIVREYTNLTAMVWAPNVAVGYPYGTSAFSAEPGTPDFTALDTNKDGKVDQLDDPYTPYWPGAEYVDWVAVSLYWFGGKWPEVFNSAPPAGYVSTTVKGTSDESKNYNQPAWDFHAMFAQRYNKPMAIPESGVSFYFTDRKGKVDPGIGELAIKRAWWRQAYNQTLFKELPGLRAVVHFEESKVEERGNVSYLITTEAAIRSAFLDDLKGNPMTWSSDVLQWECDGRVTLVSADKAQKRVKRSEL